MHVLFAALLALLVLPQTLFAASACDGTDLATTFSATERREIRALTAATPYARGNHWIARRGDQTLHLIGTLHVNDPRMKTTADRLAPLLDEADLLLMEVSPEDMSAYQSPENMSAFLLTEGPTLIDMMGDDRWAAFSAVLRQHQVAPWTAAKMRPWLLDQVLSLPTCVRKGEQVDAGLDRRLAMAAKTRGVPIGSLETMEEVIGIMNAKPLDQQVDELLIALPLYAGATDYFITMREGYFAEDIPFEMEVIRRSAKVQSRIPAAQWDAMWADFQTSLLKNRNALWLPRLLAREERSIVVAVGAAHLSGEHGLLSLLERAGYDLTRAPF